MGIGVWQVVLVLVIVLIIFGAGKLPRVMGDVAKGIKNFKSGMKEEEVASSSESKSIEDDTAKADAAPAAEKDDQAKS